MYFGTNLRYLRRNAGYSQEYIATALGYKDYTTVQKWESGKSEPRMNNVQKLADLFRVNMNDLITKDLRPSLGKGLDELLKEIDAPGLDKVIPVYASITSNKSLNEANNIVGEETIPYEWISDGQKYIAVRVSGDSMYPKFLDGDIIVVKLQDDCESGQDALVYVQDYEATLKTVIKQNDGLIRLQPTNPEFIPKVFKPEKIKIIGVVKRLRREF